MKAKTLVSHDTRRTGRHSESRHPSREQGLPAPHRSGRRMTASEPDPPSEEELPPTYATMLEAIEQGRAGRGRSGRRWSESRAFVLASAAQGQMRARIGGTLGLSSQRVTQLREEGCDAVLRGGAASAEAEQVCAPQWRRWCARGDADACARTA